MPKRGDNELPNVIIYTSQIKNGRLSGEALRLKKEIEGLVGDLSCQDKVRIFGRYQVRCKRKGVDDPSATTTITVEAMCEEHLDELLDLLKDLRFDDKALSINAVLLYGFKSTKTGQITTRRNLSPPDKS